MKSLRRLRAWFGKEKLDAEMSEEMRAHVELQAAENERRGMAPEEARYAALRSFGGVEQIKERARDQRGWVWLEQTGQDLRHAVRQLRRAPSFTGVAILTLALGIGSCTAIFSVIDRVLLHPGGVPDEARLVVLRENRAPDLTDFPASPPNYADWEARLTSFESLAASRPARVNFTGSGEPRPLAALRVTGRHFDVHAIKPLHGRLLNPGDCLPGKDHVAVVSQAFWVRALGGSAEAINRPLQLDGETYDIVGVAPSGFGEDEKLDVWLPLKFAGDKLSTYRSNHYLAVRGRLKPGVSVAAADAELKLLAAQLAKNFPDTNRNWGAFVMPVRAYELRDVRTVLFVLFGAVAGVLLIACANLANLLLARATARQREISVRTALGASRSRIVRQLLAESVLLALVGGSGGVLVAAWGLQALLALAPASLPNVQDAQLNGLVLGVALALSFVTGIGCGLVPAFLATRANPGEALKKGAPTATDGGGRRRLRDALVVAEIAAAVVLLVGAGLLTRSFVRLASVGPGFELEHATALNLALPNQKYPSHGQRLAFADALLDRIGNLPGVQAVGVTNVLPLAGGTTTAYGVVGRPVRDAANPPLAAFYAVSPGYFQALGIALLRGRVFSPRDREASPHVVVINRTFARLHFPGEDPIGKQIWLSLGQGVCEIVGVVADVTQGGLDRMTTPQVYGPFTQSPLFTGWFNVVVRSTAMPREVMHGLREAVYAVDKDQAVASVRPLEEVFAMVVARQRFATALLGVFSLVALAIAAVGIYGVMAYNVTRRTAEFGVRLALGAGPRDIVALVLGHGGRLIGLGLLGGLAGTFAATRTLQSLLYQTSAHDPLTLGGIAVLLAAVAALACWFPARRATRVDPIEALRAE